MVDQGMASVASEVPVSTIMSCEVFTARRTDPVTELVQQMLRAHVGCIPIVDEHGHPAGIVTKTDLVEALCKPELRTAADVMMPLAIVLNEHATVAHCAQMMTIEDFHHVMIVSATGALVGVVSSQDIVRWLVRADV
jgi:CBS domain-containing protein